MHTVHVMQRRTNAYCACYAEENQCILLLHNMLSCHNMQRRNLIGLSLHTKVPHLNLA